MSSIPDLLRTLQEELKHRYKGLLGIPLALSLLLYHWKIAIFLALDRPPAEEAINFIQSNITLASIAYAVGSATAYIVIFPWIEHMVAQISSLGRRKRDEFQAKEQEAIIARRMVIADEAQKLVEQQLKTRITQSKIADSDLARIYQGLLPGEQLERAMHDIEKGLKAFPVEGNARAYLDKSDQIEGKFVDPEIQEAHSKFTKALSMLVNSWKSFNESGVAPTTMAELAEEALKAQVAYRQLVRDRLKI